ncbi:MAG: serine/threonine-protein kinase [Planctomycetota bacterium]
MTSSNLTDLRVSECLADEEALFVLWAVHSGLGNTEHDFVRHYGNVIDYLGISERLIANQLLLRDSGRLLIAENGRTALAILDATTSDLVESNLRGSSLSEESLTIGPTLPQSHHIPFSHFEFLSIVGRGKFSTVWRALDTERARIVAVKVYRRQGLSEHEIAVIVRESRAAAKLQHENIVAVYECFEDVSTSSLYIVSEYIIGVSLRQWGDIHGMSQYRAAHLIATLARSLHHAHTHGVIHRAINPDNILIDGDGKPHIINFGIAFDSKETDITFEKWEDDTLPYTPPEEAGGLVGVLDSRSDIYSLGAILYEVITRRPIDHTCIESLISVDPKPPRKANPQVPENLERICLRCLAKDPRERYGTAGDVANDLQRFINFQEPHVTPAHIRSYVRSWMRRNRRLMIWLAIAITSLTLVALVRWFSHY